MASLSETTCGRNFLREIDKRWVLGNFEGNELVLPDEQGKLVVENVEDFHRQKMEVIEKVEKYQGMNLLGASIRTLADVRENPGKRFMTRITLINTPLQEDCLEEISAYSSSCWQNFVVVVEKEGIFDRFEYIRPNRE